MKFPSIHSGLLNAQPRQSQCCTPDTSLPLHCKTKRQTDRFFTEVM